MVEVFLMGVAGLAIVCGFVKVDKVSAKLATTEQFARART